ncbi:pathogen-related protein-like [Salvia splendens]|uniref:pathogen-related protein-like n=1 Tax=Salvia splendens TaxID=180675 RepID=UPI001C2583CB|nr:pathogen-related protein-like [Salvia splendens]
MKEAGDKYRSFLHDEAKNIEWRHGGPPIYDAVNKLFEEGRTKASIYDLSIYLSIYLSLFYTYICIYSDRCGRGREGLSGEETLKLGSYNALLKSSLPEEFKYYKAEEESFESSHDAFRAALPRGFAWEVVAVYSGPPLIAFKFRHWGYFEGPFKGHPPTGEMVHFYGVGILKVDDSLRAEDVEIYYDPAELFGGLLKQPIVSNSDQPQNCPFQHHKTS